MVTKFKLFENKEVIQQPFYLRGDRLYISDELAHRITTLKELEKMSLSSKWIKWAYQNRLDFFNNTKNAKGWAISTRVSTGIHVGYNSMYRMDIVIFRGSKYNNEFGNFQYYIGGNSGDHEMHGKNMVRATRECNLHFMEKLYPIVENIKDFYKKLKSNAFFDIIRNELIKNPNIAKNGVPPELEEDFGHLYYSNKYNL